MFNFKKVYNWKTIIVIAGIIITCPNLPATELWRAKSDIILAGYEGYRLCEKTSLRIPLLSGNAGAKRRTGDAALKISEESAPSPVDKLASKIGRDIIFRTSNLVDRIKIDERSFPPEERGSDFELVDFFRSVIKKALVKGFLQETANAAYGRTVEILDAGELRYIFSGRDSELRGKRKGSQTILLLPVEIKDIGIRNFIFVIDNHSMSQGAYTHGEYDNLKRLNNYVPGLFVKVYQEKNIAILRDNMLPMYTAEDLGDWYRPFYLVGQRPLGIGGAFLYARDLELAYAEHYKGEIAPEAANGILASLVARLTKLQVKHGLIVKDMNFYEGDLMINPALPTDHDEFIKITAARKLEEGTLYDLLTYLLFLRQDTRYFNGDKTEENAQVFSPQVVVEGIYKGLINIKGEEKAKSLIRSLLVRYLSEHREYEKDIRGFSENQSIALKEDHIDNLESRYKIIFDRLSRIGEEHLLDGWDKLNLGEQNELLRNIESIDWDLAGKAFQEARAPAKPYEDLVVSEPKSIDEPNDAAIKAGEEVLAWGADTDSNKDKAMFGGLLMAGGGGRRFSSTTGHEGAKGIFPDATPLSGNSFYQALIDKIMLASKAYGHKVMYPLAIAVSGDTEQDTLNYLRALPQDIKKRIIVARQKELPLVEEKTSKAFRKDRTKIATGGAGHADAYDYILKPDAHVKGLVWSEDKNDFAEEAEVAQWFRKFGVQYVQFMGIDNILTPFAMKRLVGEHHLSRNIETEKKERKAHITHILIEKLSPEEKLANFLQTGSGIKLTRDYIDASEAQKNICKFGGPSISIVTVDSLEGSETAPWSMDKGKKEAKYNSNGTMEQVSMIKLESSHLNVPRSSNSVELAVSKDAAKDVTRFDIFAETKDKEQVEEAKKLQSGHWKKIAGKALGIKIPDSIMLELPFSADYMAETKEGLENLAEKLRNLDFESHLNEEAKILVSDDFRTVYNAGIIEFDVKALRNPRSIGEVPGFHYLYIAQFLKSKIGEGLYDELERDFGNGPEGFARAIYELAGNIYRHSQGGRIVITRLFRGGVPSGVSIIAKSKGSPIHFDDFIVYPSDFADSEGTGSSHQGLFIIMQYADEFTLEHSEEGNIIKVIKWKDAQTLRGRKKIDLNIKLSDIERAEPYRDNLIRAIQEAPVNIKVLNLLILDNGIVGKFVTKILENLNIKSMRLMPDNIRNML